MAEYIELLAEVDVLRLRLAKARKALWPLAEIPTSRCDDGINLETKFNWPITNKMILDARAAIATHEKEA